MPMYEYTARNATGQIQKGQLDDALIALDRITGRVPEEIVDDIAFLRANTLMGLGRQADAAEVLKRLQNAEGLKGFAAYNLGVALLEDDRRQDAEAQLDRAGQIESSDEAVLAIRDKSNFVLGTLLVEDQQFARAKQAFDRVRLEGPFSNSALLASGWAATAGEDYERAVVPWSLLAQRERTDAAVQEAELALPFAYGKLNVHGRAALLYANALESFDHEIDRLDESLTSIRDGKFLEQVGIYDPSREAETRLELARVDHWLSVGAQLSVRARRVVNDYRRASAAAAAEAAG